MRIRLAEIISLLPFLTLLYGSPSHASSRTLAPAETVPRDPVVRLSAGSDHTCQVFHEGTARCWGRNNSGQLGDGTTTHSDTFVHVSDLTNAIAVAAGGEHTCALIVNGTVRCWGLNFDGQLGDGTAANGSNRLTPVLVSGLVNAVAIAAGNKHTCVLLVGGTVRCWGTNQDGQIGNGSSLSNFLTPVAVSGLSNVIAIAAGAFHNCALIADGTARCWGRDTHAQLGQGSAHLLHRTPVPVSDVANAVAIAAGESHTCALLANGTAQCWGENFGRLGDGTTTDRDTPVPVLGLTNAVALAAASFHTCALIANGTVRCWGSNFFGQISDGNSDTGLRTTPVVVVGVSDAVSISAGRLHTCALRVSGAKLCWGDSTFGQLGDGVTTGVGGFSTVVESVTARAIAAGRAHTCALRTGILASCWGDNLFGQIGDGTNGDTPSARTVSGLTSARAIALGDDHTCAAIGNGTVRCWGQNASGQLGDGATIDRPIPIAVADISNAVAVAAASSHTCALLANGTARCWGSNSSGQLGDGTTNSSSPRITVAVGSLINAVAIAAGDSHTCALLASGTARCWGDNALLQLGNGTNNSSPTPVSVSGLTNAVAIAAGASHTCALIANGSVRCWGGNKSGQLGDQSFQSASAPVAVAGLTNAVAIGAGDFHTCAVLANGTARCWGGNADGQLGDGSRTTRPTPAPVTVLVPSGFGSGFLEVSLDGVVHVATGNEHTCALLASGGIRCWGQNSSGQIGDGSTSDRLRPVAVPSFTLNIDPRVTLQTRGRLATVTILANCPEGQWLQATVKLTQGSATAHGFDISPCEAGLEHYPLTVVDFGRDRLHTGPAEVEADAVIWNRFTVADRQEWTRKVDIVDEH